MDRAAGQHRHLAEMLHVIRTENAIFASNNPHMDGPKAEKIEQMFDSIAGDYDRLNHLMSLDIDKSWRRRAIRQVVDKDRPQAILDAACGTGDFAIAIAQAANPKTQVTGVDLSENMLAVMKEKVERKGLQQRISTRQGNCESLPWPDGSFDRVTIAFGIRNFEHRELALREFLRVLRPGGRLVILELSVPSNRIICWLYNLYFTRILPRIGGRISGDKAAYNYLPASVLKFPGRRQWTATMQGCGFKNVRHKAFTLGICRMYTGEKDMGSPTAGQ